MNIGIISIFPNMFNSVINYGIVGRAIKNNLINLYFYNPREFADNKYNNIDDKPYGGGSGMIMKADPIKKSIDEAKKMLGISTKVIYLSPQGKTLNQQIINNYSKYSKIILLCGRYDGIDDRLIINEVNEELSIGDYIISGGELAAMIFIDSITRIIPGAVNNFNSIINDSFYNGLLKYPNYTRPEFSLNKKVPKILLSGDHQEIRKWRLKESLGRTWLKRPDLLKKIKLNKEEKKLLIEFKKEYWCN